MRGHRSSRGFTLLELVVVVAVLTVLATALTPALVQQVLEQRVAATWDEARALHEAMVGRPGESGNYGFVGDLGQLPASFNDLVESRSWPLYTTSTRGHVGMGWRGPYVNAGRSRNDYLLDEFGRPYTGASTGQVRSAGPDGVTGTADDIVYPPSAPVITGRVIVTVKTTAGSKTLTDPPGYDVLLWYSNGGVEASLQDTAAPYVFERVPMGLHHIEVVKRLAPDAGSIVSRQTVSTPGDGRTALVEMWF